MKFTRGLHPFQVLQRGSHNRADLGFGGETSFEGVVWVRVLGKTGRVLGGFSWRKAGHALDGAWEASLKGLPAGGPYTVEAEVRAAKGRAAESASVKGVLVGDLWIMAGQSNMEGQGDLAGLPKPHPLVNMYAKRRVWERAKEPTHFWLESPDEAHWYGMNAEQWKKALTEPQPVRVKGSSPGLAFARHLVKETGVPVGLLPTALGGSSIEQWNPAHKATGTKFLYGSMLEHVRQATNGAMKTAGIIWYQGESEAFLDTLVPPFTDELLALTRALRADLGDIPFIHVQIARVTGMGVEQKLWNSIQEQQRLAEPQIPNSALVAAIDLPQDDGIHIGTAGHDILGIRMAKMALKLVFGRKNLKSGPRFERAAGEGAEKKVLRVVFGQVNGRMHPARHISGFSIRDAEGKDLKLIFDAGTDPNDPSAVILRLDNAPPADSRLWYGFGCDPYCNLVDDEGMASLVFGPITL